MSSELLMFFGALLLFAAGAGAGFWFGSARSNARSGSVKAEYDAYREQVAQHFGQAAEHFQTIGREYRALYQHMASGAEALCDPASADKPISFLPADRPDDAGHSAEKDSAEDAPAAPGERPATATDTAAAAADDAPDRTADDDEPGDAGTEAAADRAGEPGGDDGEVKKAAEAAEPDETTRPDRIYH